MSNTEQAVAEAMGSYDDDEGQELDGVETEVEALEVEPKAEERAEPHHMTIDEWTEKGNDPDKYRGKKAFDDFGVKQAEMKQMQEQLKVLTEATLGMKSEYQKQSDERVAQARAEIQAELAQAEEDEDIAAFKKANTKLDALEKTKPAAPEAPQLNPSLAEFVRSNPMIDNSSDQFDADFFADWSAMHASTLDGFIGGDRSRQGELTQRQIDNSMKLAMRKAKELNPDKVVSPRNKRSAPATPAARREVSNKGGNYRARLKAMTTNSLNENDTTGTLDMYEYILKNHKQEDADAYAAKVLGDQ